MKQTALPEGISTILHEHSIGVLATYGGTFPYTSLISFVITEDGSNLIFPTLRESQKFLNLHHEARVSVLIDNRSIEKKRTEIYALSLLGTAAEITPEKFADSKHFFLLQHPHLEDFLSLEETSLIQIHLQKGVFVKEFQNILKFDF